MTDEPKAPSADDNSTQGDRKKRRRRRRSSSSSREGRHSHRRSSTGRSGSSSSQRRSSRTKKEVSPGLWKRAYGKMGGLIRGMAFHYLLGFGFLAGILYVNAGDNPTLEMLRHKTFDMYQRIEPRQPDPSTMEAGVVIIDIDDRSLSEFGQWPWPRTLIAQLVQNLTEYGVMVVGFDMIFAEEDRMSPPKLAEEIDGLESGVQDILRALPSNEDVFSQAIANSRVVLGHVGTHKPTQLENLPRKVGFGFMNNDPKPFLPRYPGIIRNLPLLEEAANGIGLFSSQPDQDGIYRRVPLMSRVGDQIFPALTLEMIRVALQGRDDYFLKTHKDGSGIESIVVKSGFGGGYEIPTTPYGEIWVHFANYNITDPIYVSATDILLKTVKHPERRLAGHLAIIGTSAIGLKDIRATPINGALPGVEVHAQVLENILSHTHLTRPDFAIMIELGMMIAAGLLLIALVPRLSALWNFLLSVSLISILCYTAWHYYMTRQMLIDAAFPSLVIFGMSVSLSYLNYIREEQERRQVKTAFSHYVSPALLEELADNPDKLKLGGETRNITLLFSDIRGFTTISEQFDAEGLTKFINRFLTPMTNVILEHKGTIDKYMGDAIMAFWNAPLPVTNHPVRSCQAALDMIDEVNRMNRYMEREAKNEGRPHIPIAIGIGINTGDCCVGNMGSDQRFDYSALGDHVNLASRLEGQSKTYGVDIVISEYSVNQLPDGTFAIIELDLLQVKGKTEPVRIFAILGDNMMASSDRFKALSTLNTEMLNAYRSQKFDVAEQLIAKGEELWPDLNIFWALYRERIADFRISPPPADWNGVFIATSK